MTLAQETPLTAAKSDIRNYLAPGTRIEEEGGRQQQPYRYDYDPNGGGWQRSAGPPLPGSSSAEWVNKALLEAPFSGWLGRLWDFILYFRPA